MAAHTAETAAAGQHGETSPSQTEMRTASDIEVESTAATTIPGTPEKATDQTEAVTAKKTPSRTTKKRKANDTDAAPKPPLKKAKKEKTKAPPKPRPLLNKKKASKKQTPPPPPEPPAEVTPVVQAKIDAVHASRATEMAHETSMLERDDNDPNLVNIPEWDLLGVIMMMYWHYQLGHAETEASISDVEEAIVRRFVAPVRLYEDAAWVTLDLSKTTALETRAKEKIARRGLDDVGLLELEMELHTRRNLAREQMYEWEGEDVVSDREYLRKLVEMQERREAAAAVGRDEKEAERKGVCPAPAVEVV